MRFCDRAAYGGADDRPKDHAKAKQGTNQAMLLPGKCVEQGGLGDRHQRCPERALGDAVKHDGFQRLGETAKYRCNRETQGRG